MYKSSMAKQKYQERKEAHVCTRCGKADTRTLAGGACCEKCIARNRKNREHRKAMGKRERPRQTAAKVVKQKKRKGQGPAVKCPYAAGLEEFGQYACLYCKRTGGCVHDKEDAVWKLQKIR